MTIRERLKAQLFKARAVAFAFWMLFVIGIILPKGGPYALLVFPPFLGFMTSVLYILFFVKCPKCGTRLGHTMSGWLNKPNFCPGCGVSFDSPA